MYFDDMDIVKYRGTRKLEVNKTQWRRYAVISTRTNYWAVVQVDMLTLLLAKELIETQTPGNASQLAIMLQVIWRLTESGLNVHSHIGYSQKY